MTLNPFTKGVMILPRNFSLEEELQLLDQWQHLSIGKYEAYLASCQVRHNHQVVDCQGCYDKGGNRFMLNYPAIHNKALLRFGGTNTHRCNDVEV